MNPILIRKEAIMETKGSLKKKKTLIPTWKIMMANCNMEKKIQRLSKIFTPDLSITLSI
jgi:hypothetical protein